MITIDDLDEAIAELEGRRAPTSTDCIKLAAYYIIKDNLTSEKPSEMPSETPLYSRAEPSEAETIINYKFNNQALNDGLNGRTSDVALMLLDELMNAVRVTNPELYRFAVRKLNA